MFEEKIKEYKEVTKANINTTHKDKTIELSKVAFFNSEMNQKIDYLEFLIEQLKQMNKKLWIAQFFVLFLLWVFAPSLMQAETFRKGMGVASSVFVILIIPEIWKNRNYSCMEIEAISYYSLRDIYSARMTLFGIVDTIAVSVFFTLLSSRWGVSVFEFIVQFLLPMVITSTICFWTLCSKYSFNKYVSMGLCLLWSGIWSAFIMNHNIYTKISIPIWICTFIVSVIALIVVVQQAIVSSDKFLEVNVNGVSY